MRGEAAAHEFTQPDLEVALDPEAAARSAGLRYVSDRQAGITRLRSEQGFTYKNLSLIHI